MDGRVARNIDWTLVVLAVALGLFGLVAVRAATQSWSNVRREAVWLVVGLVVMVAVMFTDYHVWARWARTIYAGTVVLLAAVLVVGHRAQGAQRWLGFGPLHLQPSELAKIAVVIALAAMVAPRFRKLSSLSDVLPPVLAILPPMLLVMLQPDLGTSLAFLAILAGVLFMGGLSGTKILAVGAAGLVLATGLILAHYRLHVPLPLAKYQLQRLVVFLNPQSDPLGAGFHIIQSEIAVGSGQIHGLGLGKITTISYLPEASSDFIFAIVAERMGFIGAAALLAGLFALLARGIRIAARARDPLGACLAAGVVAMLTFHVFINAGMTMGIMPVTGVPLPFTSQGGSALLTDYIGVGLLLSVHMRRKKIQF